eukprot:5514483-Prymnesium_polylepis.1
MWHLPYVATVAGLQVVHHRFDDLHTRVSLHEGEATDGARGAAGDRGRGHNKGGPPIVDALDLKAPSVSYGHTLCECHVAQTRSGAEEEEDPACSGGVGMGDCGAADRHPAHPIRNGTSLIG